MYFGTGDAVPADVTSRAAAARQARVEATDQRPARRARQSTRPHDHRELTAFHRDPRASGGEGPGEADPRGRTSRRAEPCPGSASRSRSHPCRAGKTRTRARKARMSVEIARLLIRAIGKFGEVSWLSRRPRYRTRRRPQTPGHTNDEALRLGNALPQVQVPAALEDHHDPRLFERAGAQFEQQLGCLLPVSARDLKAAGPNVLGEDG